MKHNPNNFKPGDTVIADEDFSNGGYEVVIVHMSPGGLYSTIYAKDDPKKYKWVIMTNRLTFKPATP